MTCKEYRRQAHEACQPNIGKLAVITLVYALINGLINVEYKTENLIVLIVGLVFSLVGLLIAGPLQYGYIHAIVTNYQGRVPSVENLFSGFKYIWKLLVLNLLIGIYTFLWSLLFIIPGIVKGIAYSRAIYIFYENPELSANECIKRSQELMDGYKGEYFLLMLSYFGWVLLSVLTFGILMLWVTPRMETANYILYRRTKGESEFLEENDDLDYQYE